MSGFQQEPMVSVQMPMLQWENVLRLLAEQPFKLVAALIGDIQRQCQAHEAAQRQRAFPQVIGKRSESDGA